MNTQQETLLARNAELESALAEKALDLESKNRELEIETSLERVRAVAMGMYKAEDMLDVCKAISQQLELLNVKEIRNVQTAIFYKEKGTYMNYEYYAKHDKTFVTETMYSNNERHAEFAENMQKGNGQSFELNITEVKEWIAYQKTTNVFIDDFLYGAPSLNYYWYSLGPVALGISTYQPLKEEDKVLFRRFVKVFELAYRRYLDIEQAAALARSAQIELALERVRARTMAMQKSDELAETVSLLFKQLLGLGIAQTQIRTCGIVTFDANKPMGEQWITETNGDIIAQSFRVPYDEAPAYISIYDGWKNGEAFKVIHLEGDALKEHLGYLAKYTNVPVRDIVLPQQASEIYNHVLYFLRGCLFIITKQALPEYHDIFKRFGAVFQQSYTRFLDLQKAEAQAREAQIELSLERVRAKTMAMQKSEELSEAVHILFQQFKELGENPDQATIGIINEDEWVIEYWVTMYGKQIDRKFPFSIDEPNVTNRIYKAWKSKQKSLVIELEGRELYDFATYRARKGGAAFNPAEKRRIVNVAFFSKGLLNVQSTESRSIENLRLLERFASVFEQTYTRFLDLQKAEAQALEAIKRASVDRVRAEIASMRTTADLERITPLIWNELTTLGVPFTRCGVFIMDEQAEQVHTFLSTPGGKAIATLHVPFNFNLALTRNGVDRWRRKQVYQEHWDAATFKQSWAALAALNTTGVSSTQDEHLPDNLYLHLLPFLQGMLYVGSEVTLTDEAMQLCQNLADAFATAYARYEDFNKLEAAKQEVDSALNKLQATQKQLIQSEKMASLGELTAGIAHEIQNPLNFVNNFSEVSNELIEELLIEKAKAKTERDEGLEEELLNDIRQNLEKINHHGKRADAIVKGMLQHSRRSTNQKELTDINALADEYLRLSYHGLRAKDATFNATLNTAYDETIDKINIIPQDIGRVLINLFNNAFYAVMEKKKENPHPLKGGKEYEPTVTISTKLIKPPSGGLGVSISVADNGSGIPQKIVDKIFQPFFTTKPTGQGTGLGLSLSYDIVKAHGGEIRVETKENEGTTFIIQLPII